MKTKNYNQGFTLIELLVVIAIITLLSSVIFASIQTSREKARIASIRSFVAHNEQLVSDELVGRWDFDECSGTISTDMSGNKNNANLSVAGIWNTNTYNGIGCSVESDGNAKYAYVPNNKILNLSGNFTVSMWVYLNNGARSTFITKGDPALFGAYVGYNYGSQIGFVAGAMSVENSPYVKSVGGDLNKWHNVTMVVGGEDRTLYVDGKKIGTDSSSGNSWDNYDHLFLGRSWSGDSGSSLLFDEVRVYAKMLTASEVEKHYLAEKVEGEKMVLK